MADAVANCIENGVRRLFKDANVHKIPVVDGGEGFARRRLRTFQPRAIFVDQGAVASDVHQGEQGDHRIDDGDRRLRTHIGRIHRAVRVRHAGLPQI